MDAHYPPPSFIKSSFTLESVLLESHRTLEAALWLRRRGLLSCPAKRLLSHQKGEHIHGKHLFPERFHGLPRFALEERSNDPCRGLDCGRSQLSQKLSLAAPQGIADADE